jgi:hypothetical protein
MNNVSIRNRVVHLSGHIGKFFALAVGRGPC